MKTYVPTEIQYTKLILP